MDDPRRLLDAAAEARVRIDILPRGGAAGHGEIVRIERGGVVVLFAGTPPGAGTDARCWISVGGNPYTFEASILRLGVPVPDRSQAGVLLGFIDNFRPANGEAVKLVLEALTHGGGAVALHDADARIVDLLPEEWTVASPLVSRTIFVEGGAVRLRFAAPGKIPMEVGAVVRELSQGSGHLLYRLGIEEVENAAAYREMIAAVRECLGI